MPYWKNVSESTYERPGDGVHGPWVAQPGDTVEADTNPVPGCFEEADTAPPAPAQADTSQEQGHEE